MPFIQYQTFNFRKSTLAMIDQANTIIREYQAKGFTLTLRQLYYQFVSRDLLANTQKNYKRLGSIVNDARIAGLIDWYAIIDRTRNLRGLAHWSSISGIIDACASQFRYDLWENQPNYVEVWIEKDALIGVIERVCNRLDVPYFACRGYTSQSELWSAAQRLKGEGKPCHVIHLGDHDPSGVDMTRDIEDRFALFGVYDVTVHRVALNMDQIDEYGPPPNPAKLTDSRATGYIEQFGYDSWELDALDPEVIEELIESNIYNLRDDEQWDKDMERQDAARARLREIAADLEGESL